MLAEVQLPRIKPDEIRGTLIQSRGQFGVKYLIEFIIKIVLAYALGSIIGSLVVGKIRGGVDIRTQGSGNAGGTNALRTQGPMFALWVMIIDIGKGCLAAGILPHIALPGIPAAQLTDPNWLAIACAAAVVVTCLSNLVWFSRRQGSGNTRWRANRSETDRAVNSLRRVVDRRFAVRVCRIGHDGRDTGFHDISTCD